LIHNKRFIAGRAGPVRAATARLRKTLQEKRCAP